MNDPCPVCAWSVPEGHSPAWVAYFEREHMFREHPEVVEQRLLDAGFRRGQDGCWYDTLSAAD